MPSLIKSHHHRLNNVTSTVIKLEAKRYAQTCTHVHDGMARPKIDGFSTGQLSEEVRREQLQRHNL